MLLSHRKKFIFLKTRKTAGTSVELYFEKYCQPSGMWNNKEKRSAWVGKTGIIGRRGKHSEIVDMTWWDHMSAKQIKDQISKEYWDDYFKFTIMRNPYEMIVSHFFFKKRDVIENKTNNYVIDFFRERFSTHLNFIKKNKELYMINNQICVDYFIIYEQLLSSIQYVCNHLDIPYMPETLPHMKGNFRRDISLDKLYTPQLINEVKSVFNYELTTFNYSEPIIC